MSEPNETQPVIDEAAALASHIAGDPGSGAAFDPMPEVAPIIDSPAADAALGQPEAPVVTMPGAPTRRIDLLGNVTMEVAAELGRTCMTVRDLLSLTPGTVVELDRAAGSPVDLLVNGTLVARGEVVVIDEEFGVRISEIVSGSADDELPRAASA